MLYARTGWGLYSAPGLFLLGAGAVAYRVPDRLERADRWVAAVAAVAALATVPALWWQSTAPGDPRLHHPGGITGGIMSVLYVGLLSLLWRTPARAVLAAVFEPLGRMAFTNYLSATLIVLPMGRLLGFEHCNVWCPRSGWPWVWWPSSRCAAGPGCIGSGTAPWNGPGAAQPGDSLSPCAA